MAERYVLRATNGNYLQRYQRDFIGVLEPKQWSGRQHYALRFGNRNEAAQLAFELSEVARRAGREPDSVKVVELVRRRTSLSTGDWRIAKTSCSCNREDEGHGFAVLYQNHMIGCVACLRAESRGVRSEDNRRALALLHDLRQNLGACTNVPAYLIVNLNEALRLLEIS